MKLPPFADAIAPGVVLAQAIGRWGNWFNNELYGKATDAAWGLEIHRWDSSAGKAVKDSAGNPEVLGTFHPAFLYESVWDVLTAIVLIFADRRWKLGHGRVFALYVAVYSLGRGWIETLRIDDATHILGLRLNVWTSIVVFAGGLCYLIVSARLRPGRETDVLRSGKDRPEATPVEVGSESADGPVVSEKAASEKSADEKAVDEKSTGEKAADKSTGSAGVPGEKAAGSTVDGKDGPATGTVTTTDDTKSTSTTKTATSDQNAKNAKNDKDDTDVTADDKSSSRRHAEH